MTTAEMKIREAITKMEDIPIVKLWNAYCATHDYTDHFIYEMSELGYKYADCGIDYILRNLRHIFPEHSWFIDTDDGMTESSDWPKKDWIEFDKLTDWVLETKDAHGCEPLIPLVEELKAEQNALLIEALKYELPDDDLLDLWDTFVDYQNEHNDISYTYIMSMELFDEYVESLSLKPSEILDRCVDAFNTFGLTEGYFADCGSYFASYQYLLDAVNCGDLDINALADWLWEHDGYDTPDWFSDWFAAWQAGHPELKKN